MSRRREALRAADDISLGGRALRPIRRPANEHGFRPRLPMKFILDDNRDPESFEIRGVHRPP